MAFASLYFLLLLLGLIPQGLVGVVRDGNLQSLAALLNGDEAASSKLFTDANCQEPDNCFFRRLVSTLYPWIVGDPPGGDIPFNFPVVSRQFTLFFHHYNHVCNRMEWNVL